MNLEHADRSWEPNKLHVWSRQQPHPILALHDPERIELELSVQGVSLSTKDDGLTKFESVERSLDVHT